MLCAIAPSGFAKTHKCASFFGARVGEVPFDLQDGTDGEIARADMHGGIGTCGECGCFAQAVSQDGEVGGDGFLDPVGCAFVIGSVR